MPYDFDGDLVEFYNSDDFAVEATIGGVAVNVLYDEDGAEILGVESSGPMIRAPWSSISGAADGTTVVVNGETFKVRGGPKRMNHGEGRLQLERQ